MTTARRVRKLKRRFSSGATWDETFRSLASASSSTSRSPASAGDVPYLLRGLNATDSSEIEDEDVDHAGFGDHDHSIASEDRIFRSRSGQRPLIYASLPPTPISPSPPSLPVSPESPVSPLSPTFSSLSSATLSQIPFSLWDYLREELLATDFDSHQELKWERVSNFLNVPLAVEKVR